MAFDEQLAERVREHLVTRPGYSERKMFGGLCFMLNGNMCCGVATKRIMLRVGPDLYQSTLARKGARPMDFTGRPMRGLVYVDADYAKTGEALAGWLDLAVGFAESLPPKAAKQRTGPPLRRNANAQLSGLD